MWTPDTRDARLKVALITLAAGLAWRIVLCTVAIPLWEEQAGVASFPDAYPALARSLLDSGTLGYGPYGANPTTVRGPGFPAWLALGLVLGPEGQGWVALWAALPGLVGGAILAFLLTARYGRFAGLAGGLIAVAHPLPALVSARVMADEFYGVLGFLAAACWAGAMSSAQPGRRRLAVGSGVLLGAQVLTRASGLLTIAAVALFGLVCRPRRWKLLLLTLALALAPAAAWSVRSSLLEGRVVVVHSLLGYNFWFGEAHYRTGADRSPGDTRRLAMQLIATHGDHPAAARPAFWYVQLTPREAARMEHRLIRAAARHVVEQPGTYARRWLWGLLRFWVEADRVSRTRQYLLAALPVVVLAGIGAVRAFRRRAGPDYLARICVAIILLHNVTYAATWPMARMSAQIYPALAYLCGVGAAGLFELPARFRARSRRADAPGG